ALTWADRLRELLTERRGEAEGLALASRYGHAFPLAYQEAVAPEEVLADLADLEALRRQPQALQLNRHRPAGQTPQRLHLKIVKLAAPVPISDVLPMLEDFGLRVISERPYELAWPEGGAAWIQDFELEQRDGLIVDIARVEANFREGFAAAWSGAVENDGFNRLLLGAELSARQIVMLRAYCPYLPLVEATLRTNFYQPGADGEPKGYVSFKFDPARIPDLPLPRPKFEIFVYSPRVEGVHLRMGDVARGGLRWSDRREDFRTEVLGLMKAQNVKNTLIVPVGAKGGFVPKRLPAGTREEVQAEVVACYQTFIRGLLDLTDNIVAGRIVPPAQLVRRDGDDAYLVVAADKGTATFS